MIIFKRYPLIKRLAGVELNHYVSALRKKTNSL